MKVLDFGLAKALEGSGRAAPTGSLSLSPTFASPAMTGIGMIMGTAAYMSPEQAKGKPVDKRADIWAFGVVLYEMLTGRALFQGETASEVMASVIMRDPDLTALPGVRAALAPLRDRPLPRQGSETAASGHRRSTSGADRCKADAAAGDAVETAETFGESQSCGGVLLDWRGAHRDGYRALASRGDGTGRGGHQVRRAATRKASLSLVARPAVALSPDGSVMAFVASTQGESRVYLRSLGDVTPREVPGTEGASNPVFSPDGPESRSSPLDGSSGRRSTASSR